MREEVFEIDSIYKILRSFGVITLSTFTQRVRLQKLVFLIQKLSNEEDKYVFSFYNHGPYSSGLADYFMCRNNILIFKKPKLNKQEIETVSLLKQLLGKDINDSNKLKLYATIWYFHERNMAKRASLKFVCDEQFHFDKKLANDIFMTIIKFKKEYC